MLITLERATAKDIDDYLDIERSIAKTPFYSPQTDKDEELQEFEKNIVYLIRENDRVVGSIEYVMKSPEHAYISGLAVRSDAQDRGIGKAAMVKVLEELKDVPTIDLATHPQNEHAIKLYESLGFTLGERIENYFGDGEPRVVMTLKRA